MTLQYQTDHQVASVMNWFAEDSGKAASDMLLCVHVKEWGRMVAL